MTWENILKNFKGSKIDFKTMQKNNKNYADFLEYRIGRVKSSIDKYDENKEEYNSDPNLKQYTCISTFKVCQFLSFLQHILQ